MRIGLAHFISRRSEGRPTRRTLGKGGSASVRCSAGQAVLGDQTGQRILRLLAILAGVAGRLAL
jgi:hypothetical protein